MSETLVKYDFKLPRVFGFNLLVKPYEPPKERKMLNKEGKETSIIIPDSSLDILKFTTCVGLVLDMGPLAYKNTKIFENSEPWCKIGDWVIYPRNEGHRINYKNVDFLFLADTYVITSVDEPNSVKRGS